jgi:hypothetical protein
MHVFKSDFIFLHWFFPYSRIMKGILNFLIKKAADLFSSQISVWETPALFLLMRHVMAVIRQFVVDTLFFFLHSFLSFPEKTHFCPLFFLFFNCSPYVFYCLFSSLDLLEKFLMLSI